MSSRDDLIACIRKAEEQIVHARYMADSGNWHESRNAMRNALGFVIEGLQHAAFAQGKRYAKDLLDRGREIPE